jgi:hypothetical protein
MQLSCQYLLLPNKFFGKKEWLANKLITDDVQNVMNEGDLKEKSEITDNKPGWYLKTKNVY